jgi:hypothetical protein
MPNHKDPRDFLNAFHSFAQGHGKENEAKALIDHNEQVKQKVMTILDKVKKNKAQLEQLKQTNPEAYQSMMHMVQAMISMAKEYVVPPERPVPQHAEQAPKAEQPKEEQKPEGELQKQEKKTRAKFGAGRIATVRGPAGSTHQAGADSRHHTKVKVARSLPASADTKVTPRQMDEGVTTDEEGKPVSALRRKAEQNRGQSNPGPVGPVTH